MRGISLQVRGSPLYIKEGPLILRSQFGTLTQTERKAHPVGTILFD